MTRNPMSFAEAMAIFEEKWAYAGTQPWIIDRVAWALYQTWKEADRRMLEMRGEEG